MVRARTRELSVLTGELHAEIRGRIQTEEKLLAEKAYREAMENCLVAGIVAVDPAGRHTHVNDAFCAMTGFPREELLGAGIPYPYWPHAERKAYAAEMRKVLKGEIAPGGLEFRFKGRDGRSLDVLLHASPMTLEGKVVGSLASVHDITDRKRMESALRDGEERLRISEERFRQLFEQNEEPLFLFRGGARRSSTSTRRPSNCTATPGRSWCAAASPCSFRRRSARSSYPPSPASGSMPS